MGGYYEYRYNFRSFRWFSFIFVLFPKFILSWFNATDSLIRIGVIGLRIFSLGFIISTFGIVISGVFESLGIGKYSLTISLLRQLVITLPLAYILLSLMGLNGVWLSFVISEFIASVTAIVLLKKQLAKFK